MGEDRLAAFLQTGRALTQVAERVNRVARTDEPVIEPEALPCPFCGFPATIQPWHGGAPTKRLIACSNQAGTLGSAEHATCEVGPMVTGETREEALARWNKRAPKQRRSPHG